MADTTTTIIYIFIICILSFILFLLNGCETAITTLNTLRFKAYISQKVSVVKQKQLYIRIIKIIKNFNQTIITILTGVTLCSTISATVATFLLEKVLQKDDLVTLVIFGLALFLLFFAEALPKIIAKNHPEKYLLSFY